MSFTDFQQWFEVAPIVLVGGIAANSPGGMMSILSLLQTAGFTAGIGEDSDQYFAHFKPLAGTSLIENEVGHYPFANQQVAANAIIVQPLRVALVMTAPARGSDGYNTKLSLMSGMQQSLALHSTTGGMYTVATPSNIYTNCLLLSLKDISHADIKQPQVYWQWDFEQPLLTQAQAAQVSQSPLMGAMTAGTQILPNASGQVTWSGPQVQPNSGTGLTSTFGGSSQGVYSGTSSPSPLAPSPYANSPLSSALSS